MQLSYHPEPEIKKFYDYKKVEEFLFSSCFELTPNLNQIQNKNLNIEHDDHEINNTVQNIVLNAWEKNESDDMLQFVAFKLKKSGAGNYICVET